MKTKVLIVYEEIPRDIFFYTAELDDDQLKTVADMNGKKVGFYYDSRMETIAHNKFVKMFFVDFNNSGEVNSQLFHRVEAGSTIDSMVLFNIKWYE